jgi:TRAP-type mannitol/chloroaromatic compound transport system permease large subunit
MSGWGPSAGLWMLLALAVLTVTTGMPVWTLLIGISSAFAMGGLVTGVIDLNVLSALPARLVGLLESDLLQALPLYVFVGLLLQRLSVADALFSVLVRRLLPLGGGHAMGALALGALVAPMNGSVASSAAMLARLVAPRLKGMDAAKATALVSVAATIGVVVPPSLVLILLGDAMMRAHTEASNLPGFAGLAGLALGQTRIINTQDVFHAALLPALAILLLWALVARWQSRAVPVEVPSTTRSQAVVATLAGASIVLLLAGVFMGKLYAVEAAATGGMVLVVATLATRALGAAQWKDLLSLVFRLLGTDRWIAQVLQASPLPTAVTAAGVLLMVALCAWVLDAFEMIFVVIPIVAPPLISLLGDAQQAAVLLLLVLQLSFLIPPMGYAVMMARASAAQAVSNRHLVRALAPYVLVQLALVAAVFAAPWVVHQLDATVVPVVQDSEQDIERQMQEMSAPSAVVADPKP